MPEPTSDQEIAHVEQALADIAPEFDNERLPEAKAFNPWIVAIVVTIGTFMEVLDTSIANVALPHIAGNLSASLDEGSWVLTSYLVANAVVLPISGWLSSILGRKNYFLLSVFLFTVFSAACGFAPTLGMLVLFRVAQGLAGGGLKPSVQAILADSFSPQKRGMAMSLYTIAILVAPVLGPTAGGWITDSYSWRWIFYINIPVGILCVFLTRIILEDPPHMKEAKERARKLSVDWTGLGFISVGLASLEIVLDKGQELDWFGSPFIVFFAAAALIAIAGTIYWELKRPDPIVNLRLFRERNFLFCCILILCLYAALFAATYLLPTFMQEMLGYTRYLRYGVRTCRSLHHDRGAFCGVYAHPGLGSAQDGFLRPGGPRFIVLVDVLAQPRDRGAQYYPSTHRAGPWSRHRHRSGEHYHFSFPSEDRKLAGCRPVCTDAQRGRQHRHSACQHDAPTQSATPPADARPAHHRFKPCAAVHRPGGGFSRECRGSSLLCHVEPLQSHATPGDAACIHGSVQDALRHHSLHSPAGAFSQAPSSSEAR